MKVVILGSGSLLTNLIAGCMDANCKIVGVLRNERVQFNPLKRTIIDIFNPSKEYTYIKSHKLYEIKARKANSVDFKKEILKLNPDLIIVGSWGEKIKKPIIDLPKLATINVHPALLPKYRGPNPYLQTIWHQEKTTGVTFHLMDENYDTGAILHQKQLEILENDTGKELRERIAVLARSGIKELVEKMDSEIVIPVKQDEKVASYYKQISEHDVMLDFRQTAEEISAHIRAFHPWTNVYYEHNTHFFIPNPYNLEIIEPEKEVTEEAGTVIEKSSRNASITVVCGNGKLLKMQKVKLFGILKPLTKLYIKIRCKAKNKA